MAEYTSGYREEIPDDTPVEMPLGFDRPLSLAEEVRRFVRTELSQQAQSSGQESFEEADDFDVDDDEEFITQYELTDMQLEATMPPDRDDADLNGGKNVGKVVERGKGNGSGERQDGSGSSEEDAGADVKPGVQGSDNPGRENVGNRSGKVGI